jgi:hypothetical protein
MSISQLDDASMREALGIGSEEGVVAETLLYTSASTTQVVPLPIEIRIDPPNASPLNNLRIAQFHWVKQDPNNQDKYGYFNIGDGFFKIGAEWVGIGPQTVILEGATVEVNAVGPQNGTVGFKLGNGGTTAAPSTSAGTFWMDTTGQLNLNHTLPASSTGNQVLFRPTNVTAILTVSTPVGVGGQIDLPFTSIVATSSQGGVDHFDLSGPTTLQYTNDDSGLFFVTATIALDTATTGPQLAIAHFKVNGADIAFSAVRNTINENQNDSIIIQSFIPLNKDDEISVVLTSTDAVMTATDFPAVVGPPSIPEEPAFVLVATRIA